MERFRAHEKVFKQKKFGKESLSQAVRVGGEGSDSDNNDYGSDDGDDSYFDNEEDEDVKEEGEVEDEEKSRKRSRDGIINYNEFLVTRIHEIEDEIEGSKNNKKAKGANQKK